MNEWKWLDWQERLIRVISKLLSPLDISLNFLRRGHPASRPRHSGFAQSSRKCAVYFSVQKDLNKLCKLISEASVRAVEKEKISSVFTSTVSSPYWRFLCTHESVIWSVIATTLLPQTIFQLMAMFALISGSQDTWWSLPSLLFLGFGLLNRQRVDSRRRL